MRAGLIALVILYGCSGGRDRDRDRDRDLPLAKDAAVGAADATQPALDGSTPDEDAGTVLRDSGPPPDSGVARSDAGEQCIDGPNKIPPANVFFGTDLPTYVPLTSGQILAIGSFDGCSGLLITPTWVLTAQHCGLDASAVFCIGNMPANPNVCLDALRAVDHPSGDLTLIELDQPASNLLPAVEPVPLLVENLDATWIGRTAEAAGYGQDENGNFGRREFTAEPIFDLSGDLITIDGQGMHGVCFGDSGGPLMVIATDGSVRVAAALSAGDESCVGMDDFTRIDVYRPWIESYVGTTQPPGPQPCNAVDVEGFCSGDRTQAFWCGPNDELAIDDCAGAQVCGWSTAESGWRCIDPASDPCGGLSYEGECRSNVLHWCDRGDALERNCPACGETCLEGDSGGYFCVASSCGDVDFLGKCEGDVAVWCNREGEIEELDCTTLGESCGYVDDVTGYYCE